MSNEARRQPLPADESHGTLLVYRDRIVPRSEASFLRRQYVGFTHLRPLWIGRRTDKGLDELGAMPVILGRAGALGAIDRALFKQLGWLPPRPDLAALRPRAVHAHFGRGGALALPIARALRIPLVVTFHGGDATKDKHYRRRWFPTVFQRRLDALKDEAAAFICVSDFIRDRLVEHGFPPRKLHVIRYGVEFEDEAPQSPAPRHYILYVGRFVEKKGIGFLIEAARRLERHGGAATELVLIGDGPMAAALKEEAATLRNVKFLGWLRNHETRRWMRGALAVAVPSIETETGDTEGLPNVVLEAMAEGSVVIGSRHAGIGEAIVDGVTGILVPQGDVQALAAALSSVLDDPQRCARIGAAARQAVAERFSAIVQSRQLEAMLLASIAGGNPGDT